MLTKNLVLPTDLFIGGFSPVEVEGLVEGKAAESRSVGSSTLERSGEVRLLIGEPSPPGGGALGEDMGLETDVFTTGTTGL